MNVKNMAVPILKILLKVVLFVFFIWLLASYVDIVSHNTHGGYQYGSWNIIYDFIRLIY